MIIHRGVPPTSTINSPSKGNGVWSEFPCHCFHFLSVLTSADVMFGRQRSKGSREWTETTRFFVPSFIMALRLSAFFRNKAWKMTASDTVSQQDWEAEELGGAFFFACSRSQPKLVLGLSLSANFQQPRVLTSHEANAVAALLTAASNLCASLEYEERLVKFA